MFVPLSPLVWPCIGVLLVCFSIIFYIYFFVDFGQRVCLKFHCLQLGRLKRLTPLTSKVVWYSQKNNNMRLKILLIQIIKVLKN